MPDALCDASTSAQTCEEVGQAVLNPSYFEEVIDVHIANAVRDIKLAHVQRYDAFWRRNQKKRTELRRWEKKVGKSKTHFAAWDLLYLRKAIRKLKSDGAFAIMPPSLARGGGEIATEVHCDARNILTKCVSRSKIGILGSKRKC